MGGEGGSKEEKEKERGTEGEEEMSDLYPPRPSHN